jgi:hypothetical protein
LEGWRRQKSPICSSIGFMQGWRKKQAVDPTNIMINQRTCQAIFRSGDIDSGCYLTMIAVALNPTIGRNPTFLIRGTSLGIEYLK